MRWKIIILGTICLAATRGVADLRADAGLPTSAPAVAKLNPAEVPADAKWIIYVNIDQAMRAAGAGKLLIQFLHSHPPAQTSIDRIQTIMGNKFPGDFHRIVIVGRKIGPGHGVLIIHATARQNHINKLIELNTAARTITVGKTRINTIPSSDGNGYTTFEASPLPGAFVVSRSEHSMVNEINVLSGKSAGMAGNNPLLIGAHSGVVMYLADTDIGQLSKDRGRHHPDPAWMKLVTDAWLAVRIKKGKLDIVGRLNLKSAESAAQMAQMAQGWQAAMDLAATNANADAHQRFMAGMADRLNVGAIGKVVHIHWAMALSKLLAGPQNQPPAAQ